VSNGALFRTDEAQSLVCRGFDGDLVVVDVQGAGDVLSHLVHIRRNLRSFKTDRGIDVDNMEAMLRQEVAHMFQQDQARYAFVPRVGVREVLADITEAGRTCERIHDCVKENVGVGVTGETLAVLDLHAPEDELPPLLKAMDVVAVADAWCTQCVT
jgi:hypothetical protein